MRRFEHLFDYELRAIRRALYEKAANDYVSNYLLTEIDKELDVKRATAEQRDFYSRLSSLSRMTVSRRNDNFSGVEVEGDETEIVYTA